MTIHTDHQPKTILVVDDASDNISILKKILGNEYLVRPAISGHVALKAVMVEPFPDLILLDVMMPEMDGYSVCRALKKNVHTRDIPIVFVTGKTDDEDELRGLELGAVDYITKPLRPAIVRARVKTHLAMHAARTQLLDLNKTLKDLVTIDGLTGIPNRRRFDEYLQQEWSRSLRDESPLSLVVIDIDYFKLFNDGYGHIAGDECLTKVAQTLSSSMVRAVDLTARYGGEEFSCILPRTDTAGLVKVGNRLRENINDLRIPHAYSKVAQQVTISLGGATLVPSQEMSLYILVGQADAKLYEAKAAGRNRFVY